MEFYFRIKSYYPFLFFHLFISLISSIYSSILHLPLEDYLDGDEVGDVMVAWGNQLVELLAEPLVEPLLRDIGHLGGGCYSFEYFVRWYITFNEVTFFIVQELK